jgi:hypothetical protein
MLRCSPLEKLGHYFGDTMAVSGKSRETTLNMRRAAFLCLLLLSFILSSTAYADENALSFAAAPSRPCVTHFGSANPQDTCPCQERHHKALTCCSSALAVHFAAIAGEPAFRPLHLHVAVIPGDYLPAFSNCPSQVFHPPKLTVQA